MKKISYLIFSLIIFFMNAAVICFGQCLADQKSLLIDIKSNLVFNASLSVKLANWDHHLDCCSWPGVMCSDGRIIELDLSSESLSDGLNSSSSIFHLEYLQRLNLAYNKFKSITIPNRLADLSALRYLNLSNAGFTGKIPIEISKLRELRVLDFSRYWFLKTPRHLEIHNLAGLVQNLTHLSELHLDEVDLSSIATTWCSVLSSSLPNLTVLSLSDCNLLSPVDNYSLAKLQFLSVLRLSRNNLSLFDHQVFAKFSHLVTLSLDACELEGTFPAEIFQLQTLQELDLSYNRHLLGNLPQFLGNNSLRKLFLRATNFTGTIPESVGELKMLSRLVLSRCNFHGVIPEQLWNLKNLVYIDLSYNRLSGSVQSVSSLVKLTVLFLSNNILTGSISALNWKELVQLEILDLSNNSLSGSIPAILFGMPSLKELMLSDNKFESLENVDNNNVLFSILDTLDLSSNKLQGPFPTFVFRLQDIAILSMSFNNFSQALNLSLIENLRNLSILDLSFNNFSVQGMEVEFSSFPQLSILKLASSRLKKFPDFLKNQSRLKHIDLSDNQIHGEIPKWLSDNNYLYHLNLSYNSLVSFEDRNITASLYTLDLRSNLLQGKLPNLPPFALYMDFSNNSFSSEFPSEIGMPFASNFFSLASNFFGGKIPTSICNVSYLGVLDLSNNLFNGELPPCLAKMSGTRAVLNLGKNNITGHISDTFTTDCMLRTLDLSSNFIQGKLPKSLANCKGLEVLDLGNNRIDDTFPCWLKNVSTLRVLVLRSNMLRGSIGCPDTTRTWPMLQIVDLACNKFNGSINSDSLSSWKGMMTGDNEAESTHVLGPLNYQDTVTVSYKGQQMKLVKILTVFSSMDFSRNQFSGEIPDMIGNLTSLYVLDFSHNMFSSHIPASLGNLKNLESLDLSQNRLTGQIPAELATLTFLLVLNLGNNRIDDTFPCWLKNVSTLWVLNLGKNHITGHISDTFTTTCLLRTLDLSSNFIQGKLPKSLANCKELEVLDLGNNRIDDTFPCWLKNISTLRVLVLRSNTLHGSIGCPDTDTTRTWPMLQIVDLACNKFNGSINSDSLSSWKGMMTGDNEAESAHVLGQLNYQDTVTVNYKGQQMMLVKILTVFSSMDFSRNQFSGEIPDMIGNLTSLYVLNFSHNMFSRHIPASLGNLKKLESLDLSQNRLTGQIPAELTTLTFLSVLNLSYNILEGKIPTGKQFNTFMYDSYIGNKALCGIPFTTTLMCVSPPPSEESSSSSSSIDWQYLVPGFGFIFGLGVVLGPLLFSKRWIMWHDQLVHKLLSLFIPGRSHTVRFGW